MHRVPRTLLIAIALLALLWAGLIALLLVQPTAADAAWRVLVGAAGAGILVVAGLVAVLAMRAYRGRSNRNATRLSNLEKRVASAAGALGALSPRIAAVEPRVAAIELLEPRIAAVEALERRVDAVERLGARVDAVETATKRVGGLERLAKRVEILELIAASEGETDRLALRVDELEKAGERELELLEARIARMESDDAAARRLDAGATLNSVVAVARAQGLDLADVLDEQQATNQLRRAAALDRALDALPYLEAFPEALDALTLTEARTILKGLRRAGYVRHSIPLMRAVAARSGRPEDEKHVRLYESELALYRGEVDVDVELPPFEGAAEPDVVLHVVGKALPETQSGYTLRTQYTVEAQRRVGLTPIVVAQSGASERPQLHTETYTHEGVRYYLLGGPQRWSVPWDEWMRANIAAFGEVVRIARPAVIHVHSDFMNAMIALPVARAYGIPVINETRGFWEESWLSRAANAEGWHDLGALEERFGLPDMYTLRAEREAEARSSADAVVTLARVMRDHIERVGQQLELPVPRTSIVPNAVEADDFPIAVSDPWLRDELGVPPESVTIGYISSIVEYEGIDTLLRSMLELEAATAAARDLGPSRQPSDADRADRGATIAEGPLAPLHEWLAASSAGSGAAGARAHDTVDGAGTAEAIPDDVMARLLERLRLVHPMLDEGTLREYGAALVEAARPFCETPVTLLVVGDGVELESLRALALELELERVIFTGRVSHARVREYYALIDVFVVPRKPAAVTELVTPLKPFEAMSTGRPCVFSDVGALAEIAEDSGAVALFRAGDHHDLATTIAALLADPEQLAAMSRAGAEWVRDERTWDLNALSYLDVYRSLGMRPALPAAVTEIIRLREEGIHARSIIRRLGSGPVPAVGGWYRLEASEQSAQEVITEGWRSAEHPPIRFTPELDWEAAGRENRTWGFNLHSWALMDAALEQHAQSPDEGLLRWMLEVALHWWEHVRDTPTDESMAWYDMALALRVPRLARLMIALSRSSLRDEAALLIAPAMAHVERISRDEAFNDRNNHGFFAAAASLDFARWLAPVPGAEALTELGTARMHQMLERQFSVDGGHLEHSPDYHRMLLDSFERAVEDGLIDDERTRQRIARASRVLGWMVQPDGRLVQFGDTPGVQVDERSITATDDHARFILTDGREGSPDEEELLVLRRSGYAFVRSPQPRQAGERIESSYLALQAGFHSRAHKHADDLTFAWFDRGHEILVDAGRFGYADLLPSDAPERRQGFYYGAPERQYVESTIAHNTVQVDGADLERRNRAPYGSALRECERDGDRFVLRGEVRHPSHRHARELILTPGASLEVRDTVEPTGDPIDAIAWFNMPGEVALTVDGGTLRAVLPELAEPLIISSDGELVPPVRGQESPLRGWRSLVDRELLPTWSFGFRVGASAAATITTTFRFARSQGA